TVINVAMQLVQVITSTPYGTTLQPGSPPGSRPRVGDWTMWSVVRDHTHRKYYFTTAFNGIMRVIDLNALDFDAPASKQQPSPFQSIALLPTPSSFAWCEDVTTLFA